jgi:hypothetical protein
MKSSLGTGLLLVAAAGALALAIGSRGGSTITADPVVARNTYLPTKTALAPGAYRPYDARPFESKKPRAIFTPPVDRTDPYTGEDLAPKLELAAASQPLMEIDRHDPYDSAVEYRRGPGMRWQFDDGDPWAAADSDNARVAKR